MLENIKRKPTLTPPIAARGLGGGILKQSDFWTGNHPTGKYEG